MGSTTRELPPVIVPPGQTPEPACDRKAEESHAPATLQLLDDRGKHELGHPGRPFHGDAGKLVIDGGIGKALQERFFVRLECHARHAWEERADLFVHQSAEERPNLRVGDGLVDRLVAQQPADMAERLVSGIEQADLDLLVGEHIGGHLGTGLLPGGPPVGEVVLDHPLPEGFRHDRPRVVDAIALA